MIENLSFLNEHWGAPVLGGVLVLAVIFIWKEWMYYRTKRFWPSVFLIIMALFSLAMIALKPALPIETKSNTIVVCTKNYNVDRLDSLKEVHPRMTLVPYTPNTPIFQDIFAKDTVFVLGEGVASFDLWQLKDKKVSYLGDTLPPGIVRYTYPKELTVGKTLLFKGMYKEAQKEHRLVLQAPGDIGLDSVSLDHSEYQAFELKTPMKAVGNYVLELVEKNKMGNQISKHLIPIIVKEERPLKIALVNGFPTFESKYLKNYLAEMGHEVLVRSRLTKGRYKYEYFNTTQRSLGNFSKENLKGYDLIIIDAKSLKNLNGSARSALEEGIREDGLGLFIQSDASFFRSSGNLEQFTFLADRKTTVGFPQESKLKIEKYPYQFDTKIAAEALQYDDAGQIVSGYKRMGSGRVGTSLLANTYELVLKGRQQQYRQLWSTIVEGLGKRRQLTSLLDASSTIATKNEPYHLVLRTELTQPELVTQEGYSIALKNAIEFPEVWKGLTYPVKSGWHNLHMAQDTSVVFSYFVQDSSTWKANLAYEKRMANKRLEGYYAAESKNEGQPSAISPIFLYVIFLVSIGGLWLLPKLLKDHSSSLS
ncbi:hypothetical protein [Spongiimicrobium salis]|uniref:hypothetical protein n=1 Tax=Spongiimicrobium salis TaxID=1667022 RepID=UPI00374D0833